MVDTKLSLLRDDLMRHLDSELLSISCCVFHLVYFMLSEVVELYLSLFQKSYTKTWTFVVNWRIMRMHYTLFTNKWKTIMRLL